MKKTPLLLLCLGVSLAKADEKPTSAINGVKGVKQEAVQSIKKVEPPTVVPVTPPPPTGVTQPVPPPPPAGIANPMPPPPPSGSATQSANKVEGIKAAARNAVQPVAPPPTAAISSIRAVKGVQGIIAPKQQNLEAALLMKEGGKGTPVGGGAEGGKGKAAAAALLTGQAGEKPAKPLPTTDGRTALQEFEKLTTPGS